MRFLILTQYFHPETGAPQVRLAAMIRELLRLGHTVEVVTALPNYPNGKIFPTYRGCFYRVEEWEGVRVHRVWIYAATGAGIKRLLNYFSFMITALWGLRKSQKPDYLFVESPPLFLGIAGFLAAKRWGVPFILNVADLWPDSIRLLGLMREGFALKLAGKLESWLYSKAGFVNAVTEGIREILIHDKQVPAGKVLFLPNGIDTDLFRPQPIDATWRTSLGLPDEKHIILYTGTHGYAHGMEVILEAAELLKDINVLFLLVGGGSEKTHLEKLCTHKALKNVIFFSPHPPEMIARLYSLATAGISTLRDSPLFEATRPVKILSIMACGKPVLYSGAGEGARLVAEAKAGIIIPPENPTALADAIRSLISDVAYTAQLGNNGRAYVKKHLQWPSVITAWLQQLYNSQ